MNTTTLTNRQQYSVLTVFPSIVAWLATLMILLVINSSRLAHAEGLDLPKPDYNDLKHLEEPELKRLFIPESMRAYIDKIREGRTLGQLIPEDERQTIEIEEWIPADIYLKGVIRRQDGRHVVWTQDRNSLYSSYLGESSIEVGGISQTGSVPFQMEDESFRLLPGQVWSAAEQSIKERHTYQPNFSPQLIPSVTQMVDPNGSESAGADINESGDEQLDYLEESSQ